MSPKASILAPKNSLVPVAWYLFFFTEEPVSDGKMIAGISDEKSKLV